MSNYKKKDPYEKNRPYGSYIPHNHLYISSSKYCGICHPTATYVGMVMVDGCVKCSHLCCGFCLCTSLNFVSQWPSPPIPTSVQFSGRILFQKLKQSNSKFTWQLVVFFETAGTCLVDGLELFAKFMFFLKELLCSFRLSLVSPSRHGHHVHAIAHFWHSRLYGGVCYCLLTTLVLHVLLITHTNFSKFSDDWHNR